MGVVGNLQYTPSKVVIHALRDIKRPKGVSFEEILSYAVGKYKVNQNSFKTPLKHALKRGIKYRILEAHNGRYKINSRQQAVFKKSQSAEKHWRTASARQAKKGPRHAKKNSVKRSCRSNPKTRKHRSEKPSCRPRRKTSDVRAKRRAKSELLRSKSCEPAKKG